MTKNSRLVSAAELADRYIEIILDEEPSLLVEKIADQSSKDIVKSAKALAEFRQALTKALVDQPLPDLDLDEPEAADPAPATEDDANKSE